MRRPEWVIQSYASFAACWVPIFVIDTPDGAWYGALVVNAVIAMWAMFSAIWVDMILRDEEMYVWWEHIQRSRHE